MAKLIAYNTTWGSSSIHVPAKIRMTVAAKGLDSRGDGQPGCKPVWRNQGRSEIQCRLLDQEVEMYNQNPPSKAFDNPTAVKQVQCLGS